jgi:mannose-1-phosphate guanylyltransferase
MGTMPLWTLVLAGGDGRRLSDLTRAIAGSPIPKQYCRITGEQSLLEMTLARAARLVPSDRTVVIVNRDHLPIASGQLGELRTENVVVQPRNRDTGPGLTLSLLVLARQAPRAWVAVFPSDHWVSDDQAFVAHVARAAQLLDHLPDKIVLLGVRPDRPEPGYGYLEPGGPLGVPGCQTGFHVRAFREKPSPAQAAHISRRGALWNSFVMVFRAARMLELLARVRPEDVEQLDGAGTDVTALERVYEGLAPWNFSSDFLAHVPGHLVALRVDDVAWSDWGTPQAIERTLVALGRAVPWRGLTPAPAYVSRAPAAGDTPSAHAPCRGATLDCAHMPGSWGPRDIPFAWGADPGEVGCRVSSQQLRRRAR